MIGSTSCTNWLTFGGDPVPDIDSGSFFHVPHYCDKVMNPKHFVSDQQTSGNNPEIRVRILDHFWLRFWPCRRFALSEHSLAYHCHNLAHHCITHNQLMSRPWPRYVRVFHSTWFHRRPLDILKRCLITWCQSTSLISDYCQPVSFNPGRRNFRSAARGDLIIPLTRTAHYGPRSFAIAGPTLWNLLPASLHDKQLSVT